MYWCRCCGVFGVIVAHLMFDLSALQIVAYTPTDPESESGFRLAPGGERFHSLIEREFERLCEAAGV